MRNRQSVFKFLWWLVIYLSTFWYLPWVILVLCAATSWYALAVSGSQPAIAAVAVMFTGLAAFLPIIPTKSDLLLWFELAVVTIDRRFIDGGINREEAERLLTEASSYAHHRNVIWWPLWWLSERGKLRRLIARNVRREP